jgi:hypothetical protein
MSVLSINKRINKAEAKAWSRIGMKTIDAYMEYSENTGVHFMEIVNSIRQDYQKNIPFIRDAILMTPVPLRPSRDNERMRYIMNYSSEIQEAASE